MVDSFRSKDLARQARKHKTTTILKNSGLDVQLKETNKTYESIFEKSPLQSMALKISDDWKNSCTQSRDMKRNRKTIMTNQIKLVENIAPLIKKQQETIFEQPDRKTGDLVHSERKIEDIKESPEEEGLDIFKRTEENFEDILDMYYLPVNENFSGNYDVYMSNSLKLSTYFPKYYDWKATLAPLLEETKKMGISLAPDRKLLVLDMDETMIHSDLDLNFEMHDAFVQLSSGLLPINIRPFLFEFLDFCLKYFDIAVFTAGCRDYADSVLDYLEKDKKYFKYRLYREHCINFNNIFIKDLSLFHCDLSKVVIIDNCLLSFAYHVQNGILVSSFYSETDDMDLASLVKFFEDKLIAAEDVREVLEQTFEFDSLRERLKMVDFD